MFTVDINVTFKINGLSQVLFFFCPKMGGSLDLTLISLETFKQLSLFVNFVACIESNFEKMPKKKKPHEMV